MKIPVAIKTIQDSTGRQTFTEITDVRIFILLFQKERANVVIWMSKQTKKPTKRSV